MVLHFILTRILYFIDERWYPTERYFIIICHLTVKNLDDSLIYVSLLCVATLTNSQPSRAFVPTSVCCDSHAPTTAISRHQSLPCSYLATLHCCKIHHPRVLSLPSRLDTVSLRNTCGHLTHFNSPFFVVLENVEHMLKLWL
jgi:hypothetical protein